MEPTYATYAQIVNALVATNANYMFPMTYDDATTALVNVKLSKKQPKPLTLKAKPSKVCGKSELKKYRYINKK